MNKAVLIALGSALAFGSAFAGPNGYKVEQLWNNNTGSFSSTQSYPGVQMKVTKQNNTAQNTFGDRYVAWLSTDGGVSKAKINGRKDFSIFWTMKLSTDANATRDVEGGLLLNYLGKTGFVPTSQFYGKFNPITGSPAATTSSDWTMPGYDFVASHGATITNGATVSMGLEYDYDESNPANSVQRLSFNGFQSPWLNGNWGGPVYDREMELGFYFQPLVEANNPNHDSTGDFNITSFTGEAVPEPGTFLALGLGALALLRKKSK